MLAGLLFLAGFYFYCGGFVVSVRAARFAAATPAGRLAQLYPYHERVESLR
jgi:hypothetical protein